MIGKIFNITQKSMVFAGKKRFMINTPVNIDRQGYITKYTGNGKYLGKVLRNERITKGNWKIYVLLSPNHSNE